MSNQVYLAEDEIDLRQIIKAIIKRKALILGIFLTTLVITVIISVNLPKVYETTSIIQLAKVNDEFLIKKEELTQLVLTRPFLEPLIKKLNLDIDLDKLKKMIKTENIKETDFLRIKVRYPDKEIALKLNELIIQSLISLYQPLYQKGVSLITEQIKELETQIARINKETEEIKKQIKGYSSTSETDTAFLGALALNNAISAYQNNLVTLLIQQGDLKEALLKTKDFRIIGPPETPKYPVSPKKKQILILSGFLSLIFGVFLACFLEGWQSSKKE